MESIRTHEEIVSHIKEILETYVLPAVAQHGGEVLYESFEDGVLTLMMSGACSGCAGSMMTLKMGVEQMMRHHVPEVDVVESIDDHMSTVNPFYTNDNWDHDYYH